MYLVIFLSVKYHCDAIVSGDVGDHVVVINTRHIAMEGELWRKFIYYSYTGYAELQMRLFTVDGELSTSVLV